MNKKFQNRSIIINDDHTETFNFPYTINTSKRKITNFNKSKNSDTSSTNQSNKDRQSKNSSEYNNSLFHIYKDLYIRKIKPNKQIKKAKNEEASYSPFFEDEIKYERLMNVQFTAKEKSEKSLLSKNKATSSNFEHRQIKAIYSLDENHEQLDYKINELFNKLSTSNFCGTYYYLITLVCAFLYSHLIRKTSEKDDLYNRDRDLFNKYINQILIISTISVILFIIELIFRYKIWIDLQISLKQISPRTSFFSLKSFIPFCIEVILALLHPNFALKDVTLNLKNDYVNTINTYYLNEFLCIVVLIRIYKVLILMLFITPYYTARASRTAILLGNNINKAFSFKCLIKEEPFKTLLVLVILSCLILSLALRIIEGPAFEEGSTNDFRDFANCVWNVIVTMTTVGYGDLYPETIPGKVLAVIASLCGTCIISILTLSLQNSLGFTKYEEKAYDAKILSFVNDEMAKVSGNYLGASLRYFAHEQKFRRDLENNKGNISFMENHKHNKTQLLYKKILQRKIFKETSQLFHNTYLSLSDTDKLQMQCDEFQEGLTKIEVQNLEFNKNLLKLQKEYKL